MIATQKVVVIVPIYKNELSALEKVALAQMQRVLAAYPRIVVKPESLVLSDEIASFNFTGEESFEDHFFKGIEGYNALMLSDIFYGRFLGYEFMLIHQLDAFVFTDELALWCNQPYDYIGAPWIPPGKYPDIVKAIKSKIQFYYHARYNVQKNGVPSPMQYEYKVGNGGLSLRRVNKFHELSISMRHKMDIYLTRHEHEFNEDIFWSIEVNRKRKLLKIPSWKAALKFSIEQPPARCIELNNNQLPFGCHAWDLYPDFWRPIFKTCGYQI
ncbi:DUF5672 family protein [Mucilaginibacter ginsenosidivorax]|uniref:DUF5672 domain-containing protein n=1 Tax=Mucilaginibacter ginsenosidivorax TaxID=862126 RepID=A0A5B8W0G9_9SPHI|nr:DUF5672 family protein [Mucilaginibacter ginsenosidivorax]QEC76385.1 hypothetical protein FSB76_10660 [Mucilaginibacter ginsenosidivorax]